MRTKSISLRSLGLAAPTQERYPKKCEVNLGNVAYFQKISDLLDTECRLNPGQKVSMKINHRTGTVNLFYSKPESDEEFRRRIDRALMEMRVTNAKRFFK